MLHESLMAHGVYRQMQKRGVNYFTSIQGSMDEPLRQVLMRDFAVIVPEVFTWHQRIRDGRRDGLKAYLQGAADFFVHAPHSSAKPPEAAPIL